MPRSLLVLAAAVLSLLDSTYAQGAAKQRLCSEVCWITDVANHDACQKRCWAAERPTDHEAEACENCIDDCAVEYLGKNPCLVVYTECRRGCFHKYFPTFMPGYTNHKARRSIDDSEESDEPFAKTLASHSPELEDPYGPPEIHAPGVPTEFRKFLAGTDYPVGREVCQIACRVKLQDTILHDDVDAEDCVDYCLENPTQRDQELQVALDCGNKCPSEASVFTKRDVVNAVQPESEPCLKSCATEKMNERKASAAAAPRTTRTPKQKSTSLAGYANKAQKTGTQKYAGLSNNTDSVPTISPGSGVRKSPVGHESYDDVISVKSAAAIYFQSSQFFVHAVCTMICAAAIGMYMI
ncbi:hypothetical protein EX30DRAFT_342828 [Ascodesmis nigricans]|uniref:Extracellular membrane protein CFEM domain-containing protein n=1 Tax=Ascodesmis nigricans TaxID=341454 RepID=A0A4S2MPD8_9PEZI|nr:hypothetical protein EX30DRAFT_342828 [Ascodesmis nigricans]